MKTTARTWARLPEIYQVRASGDGSWAFWTGKGDHGADVFCAPVAGGLPEQLTFGVDHHDIRDVSADGMRLILGQSRNGSEHDHLLLLDRTLGNRLRLLTPKQEDHFLYGGVFTPDGTGVVFLTDHDYATGAAVSGAVLWRQDLATGARVELARLPRLTPAAPEFSPDGTRILLNVSARAPGSGQIWLWDGALREVFALGERENTRGTWIDDDRIAVISDHEGRDRVGVLSLTHGMEWLGGEPDFCPHEVIAGHGRWAVVAHDHGQVRSYEWREGWQAIANPSSRRSFLPWAALPQGWLGEAYDADAPHEVWASRRLDTAKGRGCIAPRDFRWAAPDGAEVQGWLYLPDSPKGLIVKVHGGPTWHSEDWCHAWTGFFTDLGWAVLDPNYRGSTGFGHDWRAAIKHQGWGAEEQADIRAGIKAVLALGVPAKVCVTGVSYGGFSSFYALTRMADLVGAVIPVCGMWKLDLDFQATGQEHLRDYSIEMMGSTPEEVPERYRNGSPGSFVADARGAALVVQGLCDTNVAPENAHAALRDLRAAGLAPQELFFRDEGHGITRPANLETFFLKAAAFLERVLC